MTFEEFRALFPTAALAVHLNHAGTSPIARPVAESVTPVLEELMGADILVAYLNHIKRQEELRAALGRMMNASTAGIGFVRNTSHGVSIIAQSIPFRSGDTVVVPEGEYPSNIYPWMAQESRGGRVRLVPPGADGLLSEDDLMAACDDSTRVLAVSWVQWHTGQQMDLKRLGAFCRERGIYFSVDVVQGLGALRLDLQETPVDFATAGCHKWLLAPGGLGMVYVHPEIFGDLLATNVGWNSVEKPIEWERLHFDELRQDARRFEEGTPALLATATLAKSVELLEAIGFDAVNDRVRALAEYALNRLSEAGMTVITPGDAARRSGIACFRHPSVPHAQVLEAMAAANVIIAERGGNLRFAPHAYNTEADIDAAMAVLAGLETSG